MTSAPEPHGNITHPIGRTDHLFCVSLKTVIFNPEREVGI